MRHGKRNAMMKWEDYIAANYSAQISLKLGAARTQAAAIRVAVFRMNQGARVWWAVGDLHKILGMCCKSYPSRWVSGLWPRWKRFVVGELRVHEIPTRSSNLHGHDRLEGKVLPYAAVSTLALLGLVLRFVVLPRARGWPVCTSLGGCGRSTSGQQALWRRLYMGFSHCGFRLPKAPRRHALGRSQQIGTSGLLQAWFRPEL